MKANLFLLTAAIFWGLNFHFAKFMLGESTFIEAGSWRYIFGVVAIVLILLGTAKMKPSTAIPYKGIFLVGFIGLFGFNMLFFSGLQFTSALNASLIVSLNPITTILLSALILKTQISRMHVLGAIISFFGVLVLLTQGSFEKLAELDLNKGDLMIFGSNIVFALHHVWVKQYKKAFSNLHFTVYTNLICLLGFLAVSLFTQNTIHIDHSNYYWLWATGIGVFGTGIAYILWNSGVSQVGAASAGIFMNAVPLATAIGSLILGLEIQYFHYLSAAIIILGITISRITKRAKESTYLPSN